jgi:hypothetical protein
MPSRLKSRLLLAIMTKPVPLAVISTLPVIVACALLGATEARAAAYVVTLRQVGQTGAIGTDVVATSNAGGEFDTTGLTSSGGFGIVTRAQIAPGVGQLTFGDVFFSTAFDVSGPTNFRFSGITGTTPTTAAFSTNGGPIVAINAAASNPSLILPAGYISGTPLAVTRAIFANKILECSNPCLDGLGVEAGRYTWTWGAVRIKVSR